MYIESYPGTNWKAISNAAPIYKPLRVQILQITHRLHFGCARSIYTRNSPVQPPSPVLLNAISTGEIRSHRNNRNWFDQPVSKTGSRCRSCASQKRKGHTQQRRRQWQPSGKPVCRARNRGLFFHTERGEGLVKRSAFTSRRMGLFKWGCEEDEDIANMPGAFLRTMLFARSRAEVRERAGSDILEHLFHQLLS